MKARQEIMQVLDNLHLITEVNIDDELKLIYKYINDNITIYPEIIHTCPECQVEIAKSKDFNQLQPCFTICVDCYNKFRNMRWAKEKYDL